jgi:hypothetical protein
MFPFRNPIRAHWKSGIFVDSVSKIEMRDGNSQRCAPIVDAQSRAVVRDRRIASSDNGELQIDGGDITIEEREIEGQELYGIAASTSQMSPRTGDHSLIPSIKTDPIIQRELVQGVWYPNKIF